MALINALIQAIVGFEASAIFKIGFIGIIINQLKIIGTDNATSVAHIIAAMLCWDSNPIYHRLFHCHNSEVPIET